MFFKIALWRGDGRKVVSFFLTLFLFQGKWRPSERESGGRGGDDWGDDGGQRWEEEEVDPEDLHHGPGVVQNGVEEDHKEPPSDGRARQQSGREGGGGDDGEVEQEPSQSAPDWDSIPATEPPKHKTSGDHLEYMAGNLVDSLVNEPEEVRTRIKYATS